MEEDQSPPILICNRRRHKLLDYEKAADYGAAILAAQPLIPHKPPTALAPGRGSDDCLTDCICLLQFLARHAGAAFRHSAGSEWL